MDLLLKMQFRNGLNISKDNLTFLKKKKKKKNHGIIALSVVIVSNA